MKPFTALYVRALVVLQVALLAACGQNPIVPAQSGNSAAPVAPAGAPVTGPERLILAFGDSLYAGYQLKRGEGLPDELQIQLRRQGINARVIGAGVSGETTAAGRKRLTFALDKLPRKPDLVVLGLGGNDALRQLPVAETRANMVAMLDELRRRDIPVVLTGMIAPPNLGPDYADRFNAIWPDLARAYGAALDPFILQGVIGNRKLMLADGIHPNAQGVDVIAKRLAPIVAKQLSSV